jgi:hypothetical protein
MTKLLSREQDIAELKDLVDELRSENCIKVTDIICEHLRDWMNYQMSSLLQP